MNAWPFGRLGGNGAIPGQHEPGEGFVSINVTPAKERDHHWLRNVYPLFLHDLSTYWGGYRLNEAGCWEPNYLDFWLAGEEGANPFIISTADSAVGFAFIGRQPFNYMSPDRDLRVSEFFILRPFRKKGYGRSAAETLFKRFPGKWELAVVSSNKPAMRFWRGILHDHAGKPPLEIVEKEQTLFVFNVEPDNA